MIQTKFQGHGIGGFGQEDLFVIFFLHRGHFGHATLTIQTNFCSSIVRRLHMRSIGNRPDSCLKIVDRQTKNDGGLPCYKHPWSLWHGLRERFVGRGKERD